MITTNRMTITDTGVVNTDMKLAYKPQVILSAAFDVIVGNTPAKVDDAQHQADHIYDYLCRN